MSDPTDTPSLKDLADKDTAAHKEASPAAPDDAVTDEPVAQSATKSGNAGLTVFIIVIVIVIVGGIAAWPLIGPKLDGANADLRGMLGLNAPVRSAETTPEAVPETSTEPAPEAATETATETAPKTATGPASDSQPPAAMTSEAAPADEPAAAPAVDQTGPDETTAEVLVRLAQAVADLKTEVATLNERVRMLEDKAHADPTAPAQALVLGATQLRSQTMGDGAFADELATLETIAGSDPKVMDVVQRLRPHADVGVPTEAQLTARFPAVARDIINANLAVADDGWQGRVKQALGKLVTVRRTDPNEITDAVARAVAVSEAALELGDLGKAVEALSQLEGPPSDAAAAWLGDARARTQVDDALDALHRHALTALAKAGGR